MRKLVIAVIALVVLAGAGLATWMYLGLESRVARAIEQSLSATTGTPCRVGSVELRLREGSGTVRSLVIPNPEGFSSKPAVEIGRVDLKLDLDSIRRSPIVIDEATIVDTRVRIEVAKGGGSNLDALRKHAQSASSPGGGEARLLRLDRLVVDATSLTADLSALGQPEQQLDIERYVMNQVGGKPGSTADVVAQAVILELTKRATKAAAKQGLMRGVDAQTGGVGSKLKGLFKKK